MSRYKDKYRDPKSRERVEVDPVPKIEAKPYPPQPIVSGPIPRPEPPVYDWNSFKKDPGFQKEAKKLLDEWREYSSEKYETWADPGRSKDYYEKYVRPYNLLEMGWQDKHLKAYQDAKEAYYQAEKWYTWEKVPGSDDLWIKTDWSPIQTGPSEPPPGSPWAMPPPGTPPKKPPPRGPDSPQPLPPEKPPARPWGRLPLRRPRVIRQPSILGPDWAGLPPSEPKPAPPSIPERERGRIPQAYTPGTRVGKPKGVVHRPISPRVQPAMQQMRNMRKGGKRS